MKHADIIFQFILFVITASLALAVLLTTNSDAVLLFFMLLGGWMFVLFICQVTHSFTIAVAFWNKKGIRVAMRIYWILLGAYLLFLLLNGIIPHGKFKGRLMFPVVPALIASYFWCVTVYFWLKQLVSGSSSEQRNGVMNRLSRFLNKTP